LAIDSKFYATPTWMQPGG